MNVQVFDVLPSKKEVGVHDVLGRDEGGRSGGVEEFASFGAVGADVLEGDGGVGFVDGVEGAVVADVLFRDEGDATPCRWGVGNRLGQCHSIQIMQDRDTASRSLSDYFEVTKLHDGRRVNASLRQESKFHVTAHSATSIEGKETSTSPTTVESKHE